MLTILFHAFEMSTQSFSLGVATWTNVRFKQLYNHISTIYPLLLALSVTCSLPFQKHLCTNMWMYLRVSTPLNPLDQVYWLLKTECKELTIQTDIRQWMYFSLIKLFFQIRWTWAGPPYHKQSFISPAWSRPPEIPSVTFLSAFVLAL